MVAVLHSHLSEGERHDEWHKIQSGRSRIVVGARSAIFAPLENLGLIVVDEEHETSYKQEEAPRYHARDVAVVRGKLEGCVVLLGTATPSLESYFNATRGKYQLLNLTQRVDDNQMPLIRVVDLRQEKRKAKSLTIIGDKLHTAIIARLEKREQTILFLNRRGFSTSLLCSSCGEARECPNCSVALTFHRTASRLSCHLCGHTAAVPKKCPACHEDALIYSGFGTEKVEAHVMQLFPKAEVRRMDADSMTRKDAYRETLRAFRAGKIDILVGTQMIAKGLHFPERHAGRIINADLALHLPDFRAGERTFQLLTQGRRPRRAAAKRPARSSCKRSRRSARRFSSRGITTSPATSSRSWSSASAATFRRFVTPCCSRCARHTKRVRSSRRRQSRAAYARRCLPSSSSASLRLRRWRNCRASFVFTS
jgi:primosomal protein N' (replication factor Y)